MDFVKKAIWGPDPKEQFRKCQQSLRKSKRQVDRQIQDLNNIERKSKSLIKTSAKKGDMKAARLYARELQHTKKVNERMHVSKATLNSIELKLNEQQQLIKIKGSLQKSTAIMQDMNQLVRLPQLSRTVQDLSKELLKSGIIDEMVDDIMDDQELLDDESETEEVDELLADILGEDSAKLQEQMPQVSTTPVEEEENTQSIAIEENDDDEDLLQNMRQRLNALQE